MATWRRVPAPDTCSWDRGGRRGPVPVSAQQHAHREGRALLLAVNSFDHAATADLTRVPHTDALHHGTRPRVVTDRARHHRLYAEHIERKRQPGAPHLRCVSVTPELV